VHHAASLAESIVTHLHENPHLGSLESVNLHLGKGGIFDVYADGKRIFSKHETGEYPNRSELLQVLFPSS
jgi:predicted Rdx family selenoprotein